MNTTRRRLFEAMIGAGAMMSVPGAFAKNAMVPALPEKGTSVQLIRSATLRVRIAGTTFLVDPMLSKKDAWPGFEGTVNSQTRNPMRELPFSAEKVLEGVSAVLLTHTHEDHWDEAARRLIDKSMPIFVNDDLAKKVVSEAGFKNVTVLDKPMMFKGVKLSPMKSQHGTEELLKAVPLLGTTMGILLQAQGERSVYVVGDTIWKDFVSEQLREHKPDVVVLNTGNAMMTAFPESIIMGSQDFLRAYQEAPQAKIIAVHMDAINHCVLKRADLRWLAKASKLDPARALIPEDGEVITA